MNPTIPDTHATVLHKFVRSTRDLIELLEDLDPAKLDPALKRQCDAFEAVRSAASQGLLLERPELAEAIEQGRKTFIEAQKRIQEIRAELEQLRSTRARTSRRRNLDSTAHFVSQRI